MSPELTRSKPFPAHCDCASRARMSHVRGHECTRPSVDQQQAARSSRQRNPLGPVQGRCGRTHPGRKVSASAWLEPPRLRGLARPPRSCGRAARPPQVTAAWNAVCSQFVDAEGSKLAPEVIFQPRTQVEDGLADSAPKVGVGDALAHRFRARPASSATPRCFQSLAAIARLPFPRGRGEDRSHHLDRLTIADQRLEAFLLSVESGFDLLLGLKALAGESPHRRPCVARLRLLTNRLQSRAVQLDDRAWAQERPRRRGC